MRYLLKTKNATAPIASRRTITIAAMTPPEGREEESFALPARADSAGTVAGEVTAVFPEAGLWGAELDVTAAVVRGDDDDDDDDSMISGEAESVELGTGVVVEVEPPTTLLGAVKSPVPDGCTLATTLVGTGVLEGRTLRPSWS
jgi:hypothetical protein